jgi:two-component system response regulator FixJ
LERLRLALEFDATTRLSLLGRHVVQTRFATLTPREGELLGLLVSGLSNKQAAARMNVSVRTVEIHRASVMKKTEARNTAHLVRMTMELRNQT